MFVHKAKTCLQIHEGVRNYFHQSFAMLLHSEEVFEEPWSPQSASRLVRIKVCKVTRGKKFRSQLVCARAQSMINGWDQLKSLQNLASP